ncbi:lysosomal acid lipase/cholesteryl ester hydrolase-like [Amblyomma americanum]
MIPALMIAFWLRTLALLIPLAMTGSAASDVYEDAMQDPAGLMRSFGYEVEVHKVTTEDGYILEVDRILPRQPANGSATKRSPMLLVHGLLCNAATWTANQPWQSPGFLLADAGFDVWLINTRGVPQSNYHVTLSTKDPRFWKWSFDEIGRYDLPATVDLILKETGSTKVGMLVTSQGTTVSLIFLSMRPEYNDKVNILVNYAPVGNLTYFTSPFRLFIPVAEEVKAVNDLITKGALLVQSPAQKKLLATICEGPFSDVCYLPFTIIYGFNRKQHNSTRVPVYVVNLPVGTSSQDALHYAQVFRRKNLVRFDYGAVENLVKYGTATPPAYPLEKIRVPVAVFQGLGDIFADPKDVEDFCKRLQKVLVFRRVVPDPEFGHLDFIFGFNATDILHRPMIELVSNYTTDGA